MVRDFCRDPRGAPNGEGTASISVAVFEKIDIEGIPLAPSSGQTVGGVVQIRAALLGGSVPTMPETTTDLT